MLEKVLRDNHEALPVVFSQASECLQLVCGMEVKEVDPRESHLHHGPHPGPHLRCDAE
ncbi:Melanoma antigen, partial [Parelaphostrongylus tenuis]